MKTGGFLGQFDLPSGQHPMPHEATMFDSPFPDFRDLNELLDCSLNIPVATTRPAPSPKAACYARFSSDLQRTDSLDQQQRACRDAAKRNDHQISDELLFTDEAVSGTKLMRKGLQAMVRAAAEGRFRELYIYSLSRLARETAIAIPLVKTLVHRYGIRVISVAEGIDSHQTGWEMALQVLSLVHEQYVRDLSANVRRGHEASQRRGHSTGDYPLGYRSIPAPGYTAPADGSRQKVPRVCAIDQAKAEWVLRIFEMYVAKGYSLLRIAKELNQAGTPKDHRSSSRTWHPTTVRSILANPKYTGRWYWGRTRTRRDPMTGKIRREIQSLEEQRRWLDERPGLRIVSDEQFMAAQRRLLEDAHRYGRGTKGQLTGGASVERGQPSRQLLSCLIVCGHCGKPFYVSGSRNKYLICSRHLTGECECRTQLRRQLAERLILAEIGKVIRDDAEWREAVVMATQSAWRNIQTKLLPRRRELEQLVSDAELTIARLVDLVENGNAPVDICVRLEQRRAEQVSVDAELRELDRVTVWSRQEPSRDWIIAQLERLHEALNRSTPAAAKALRQLVGGKIVVTQIQVPGKKRCYLQGRFSLHFAAAIASFSPTEVSTQTQDEQTVEIVIDFVDPNPLLERAEAAWTLHQAGKLNTEIAAAMKISRSMVTKLMKLAATHHGFTLEDGRTRRGRIKAEQGPPRRHELIADEVMELVSRGSLLTEIAQQLGTHRDMITAAIRYWHESRDLPVPDGRTRRKSLAMKSMKDKNADDPGACQNG
jgi:DNA invertase Pin-like site-specific DNA recombinase